MAEHKVDTDRQSPLHNRGDAVVHNGRWYVPTIYGRKDDDSNTKWVDTIAQLREAGGAICFSEDQTTITLALPPGFKFSIQMFRK